MATIRKYWFLIALVVLMASGYASSSQLQWLSDLDWLKWSIVFVTMFLMAWPISFGQVQATMRYPLPAILASVLNVIVIPLLAWPVAFLAGTELGAGILVAAATPSTLASAAVLTRRATGNDSVAVMVTILTNATCFLVLPFWLFLQTGSQLESNLFSNTMSKLLMFVVLPMSLGQLARLHQPSAKWSTKRKSTLGIIALSGVLSIVFLGSVKLGLRMSDEGASELNARLLLITFVIVTLLHLLTFGLGIFLSRRIGLERRDAIAVAFSGSQKTLMIGLSTAISLGFSFIPIVLFHTVQLIIDALIAEKLRGQAERHKSQKTPEEE